MTAQNFTQAPAPQQNATSQISNYPYTMDYLLNLVIEKDASDLHITVGYPAMIRIDGILHPVGSEILTSEIAIELINKILNENKKELLDINREVDFAYSHENKARFRVNAFYQKQTISAALRLIPDRIKTIDELNLPSVYYRLTKLGQGLVLVTGPTGHGKTTTLAAMLQEINQNRPVHIITIEDPIEYILPKAKAMVDQREMHDDTHSWEIALKSAMRQDPDVILVGEMRDYETISAAVTLAETGHLVFATLHTNNAAQTVDRIIDVFPEHQQAQIRAQLSNILEAIIAQRLVPLQGGGRKAASEIMLATNAVRNLVREGKSHQLDNVIMTGGDIGMISLESSLVKMIREGLITMEKAQEFAARPEEIVRLLKS
jgi:twitching motility protein PilT